MLAYDRWSAFWPIDRIDISRFANQFGIGKNISVIRHLLVLGILLLGSLTAGAKRAEFSVTLHPWHISHLEEVLPRLSDAGVSTVTVFLKWGRVELKPGHFDYSYYLPTFDRIVAKGFDLIIRLDAGGGIVLDENGKKLPNSLAIPTWVRADTSNLAYDALGKPTAELSYFSDNAIANVDRFYANATRTLIERYGEKIRGLAIVLTAEQEVRYGQNKYTWRDFNPIAVERFREKYSQDMPFINYAQRLPNPKEIPGYHNYNQFRAEQLRKVVCRLHATIKANKGRSIGYFGSFFGPHDGIMLLSSVGEVPDCLDVAVMDYNFMDGWELNPDPWRMAVMTNYAMGLGYPEVLAGYYVERYRRKGAGFLDTVDPSAFAEIAKSMRVTRMSGVEIAGFGSGFVEFEGLSAPVLQNEIREIEAKEERKEGIKVGILASHETFNFFIADRYKGRNIHSQALLRTYEMFYNSQRFVPQVISSRTIERNPAALEDIDIIYIPHQPVLNDKEVEYINSFKGLVMQDMRAGTYTADGRKVDDFQRDTFCIDSLSYANGNFTGRTSDGERIRIDRDERFEATHAVLTAKPGCEVLMPSVKSPRSGLFVRNGNRLTIGAIPPLLGHKALTEFTLNLISDLAKK